MAVDFSIIIATYERVSSLRDLLKGIERHFSALDISHEVIVANNASDERIAQEISILVGAF